MGPKKAGQKKKEGKVESASGDGSAVSAGSTSHCFCHNGVNACSLCRPVPVPEVLELSADATVVVNLAEIEKSAQLIVCASCRKAALDSINQLTEVFVLSTNPEVAEAVSAEKVVAPVLPEVESTATAKKKKSKGKKADPPCDVPESQIQPNPNESEAGARSSKMDEVPLETTSTDARSENGAIAAGADSDLANAIGEPIRTGPPLEAVDAVETNNKGSIEAAQSQATTNAESKKSMTKSAVKAEGRVLMRVTDKDDKDAAKVIKFKAVGGKKAQPKEQTRPNTLHLKVAPAKTASEDSSSNAPGLSSESAAVQPEEAVKPSEALSLDDQGLLAMMAEDSTVLEGLPDLEPTPMPALPIDADASTFTRILQKLDVRGIASATDAVDLFDIVSQMDSLAAETASIESKMSEALLMMGVHTLVRLINNPQDQTAMDNPSCSVITGLDSFELEPEAGEPTDNVSKIDAFEKIAQLIDNAVVAATRLFTIRCAQGRFDFKRLSELLLKLRTMIDHFKERLNFAVIETGTMFISDNRYPGLLSVLTTCINDFDAALVLAVPPEGAEPSESTSLASPSGDDVDLKTARSKRSAADAGFANRATSVPKKNNSSKVEGFVSLLGASMLRARLLWILNLLAKEVLEHLKLILLTSVPLEVQGFADIPGNDPFFFDIPAIPDSLFDQMSLTPHVRFARQVLECIDVNVTQIRETYPEEVSKFSRMVLMPTADMRKISLEAATKKLVSGAKKSTEPERAPQSWTKFSSKLIQLGKTKADGFSGVMAPFLALLETDKQAIISSLVRFKNEQMCTAECDVISILDVEDSSFKAPDDAPYDNLKLKTALYSQGQLVVMRLVLTMIVEHFFPSWKALAKEAKALEDEEKAYRTKQSTPTWIDAAKALTPSCKVFEHLIVHLAVGQLVTTIIKANAALGCVRSCSDAACVENGYKGGRKVLMRVLPAKIKGCVEENLLLKLERDKLEKDRKRKDAEERKRQEEAEKKRLLQEEKERREKERLQKEEEERERLRAEREAKERLEMERRKKEAEEKERLREEERRLLAEQRAEAAAQKRRREEEERKRIAEANKWTCNRCTVENPGNLVICDVCQFEKGRPYVAPQMVPAPEEHQPSQAALPTSVDNRREVSLKSPVNNARDENEDVAPPPPPLSIPPPAGQEASVATWVLQGNPRKTHIPTVTTAGDLRSGEPAAPEPMVASMSTTKVKGLTNEAGENSCFLNVVVQSLWHLRSFSEEFMKVHPNDHFCPRRNGQSCLVCSLRSTFANLETAQDSLVSSVEMRKALADAFGIVFSLGAQQDASEALEVVLGILHKAQQQQYDGIGHGLDESRCTCQVHLSLGSSFAEGVECSRCRRAIEGQKFDVVKHGKALEAYWKFGLIPSNPGFSCYVRYVQASLISALASVAVDFQDRLRLALEVEPISCPVCDKKDQDVERIMTKLPSVYTIGVVWMSSRVADQDIRSFLESISEHVDLCKFEGKVLVPGYAEHHQQLAVLRGMMCYYGSHYAAYFRPSREFNPEHLWYMFDDSMVKPIGRNWIDVARSCLASKFQPVALFYECEPTLRPENCSFAGVTL